MRFNKMKLGKKGSASIVGSMTELTTVIIVVALMSFIVITFIIVFAPLVQEKAQEAAANATARNNTAAASLWGIFGTEGVFEILAISVYLLIVTVIMISLINQAVKRSK